LWLAALPLLGIGIVLSFSRGAWLCAGVGLLLFVGLQFVTAPTARMRRKLTGLVGAMALGGSALVLATLQLDGVADLFAERAALTQDYDEGPDGRSAASRRQPGLAQEHVLGIGAQQFGPYFHHEEPDNTYLALFLNAGWLGGACSLPSLPPRSGTVCAMPCAALDSSQLFLPSMPPLPDTRSKRP
jgi:hypothetical protein